MEIADLGRYLPKKQRNGAIFVQFDAIFVQIGRISLDFHLKKQHIPEKNEHLNEKK